MPGAKALFSIRAAGLGASPASLAPASLAEASLATSSLAAASVAPAQSLNSTPNPNPKSSRNIPPAYPRTSIDSCDTLAYEHGSAELAL